MPTYDYACDQCGPFEALRSMDQRTATAVMCDRQRLAMSTNERASHEPVSSKSYVPRAHPSGSSCCSGGGKAKATAVAPNGNKSFPAKRPWMISH